MGSLNLGRGQAREVLSLDNLAVLLQNSYMSRLVRTVANLIVQSCPLQTEQELVRKATLDCLGCLMPFSLIEFVVFVRVKMLRQEEVLLGDVAIAI